MKKQVIKYTGNIITILSIIFVVKVALSLNIDLSIIHNPVRFSAISIICCLIMSTTVFLLAYGWRTILSVLAGEKVKYKDAACIYAKANIGKYLPGNVMHYVERNLFAGSLGLDQKAVLLSTLTEIAGLVSICTIFSVTIMGRQIGAVLKLVIELRYMIGAAVLIILLVAIILISWKKIRKLVFDIPWKLLLISFLITIPVYFFYIILGGCTLTFLFFSLNMYNLTPHIIFVTLTAYTISWVIGFVIPGAPGGIGVREFVLLFLLKDSYSEELILTCILVHRFISILGDILAYLAAWAWKNMRISFWKNSCRQEH